MTINLSSYKTIQSNLFVRIQVDQYRTTSTGGYTQEILRFSDSLQTVTINAEQYLPLGRLMSIGDSRSELRVTGNELDIVLSGIPDTSLTEILYSKIKGSPVRIYRLLSDASTGVALNIPGNPAGRYRGFVNNYSLNEEYDTDTRTSSNTIVLNCASSIDVLTNKFAGRKTNPQSQKKFYPGDISMDRVPTLENATFDFGKKI
jgi:hypothetical protein